MRGETHVSNDVGYLPLHRAEEVRQRLVVLPLGLLLLVLLTMRVVRILLDPLRQAVAFPDTHMGDQPRCRRKQVLLLLVGVALDFSMMLLLSSMPGLRRFFLELCYNCGALLGLQEDQELLVLRASSFSEKVGGSERRECNCVRG